MSNRKVMNTNAILHQIYIHEMLGLLLPCLPLPNAYYVFSVTRFVHIVYIHCLISYFEERYLMIFISKFELSDNF